MIVEHKLRTQYNLGTGWIAQKQIAMVWKNGPKDCGIEFSRFKAELKNEPEASVYQKTRLECFS